MRKAVGILLLIVAFVLTAVGGFLMYQKIDGYRENEAIYDNVASMVVNSHDDGRSDVPATEPETESTVWEDRVIPGMAENEYHEKPQAEKEEYKGTTINWEQLNGNKNIVGWIIFGDMVNYPIMQGNDNSYYLKHAYNGASNSNGSIFMNANNDGYFRDLNTIIYGHNLKSGRMFGTFKQYTKKSKKDLHFYIYTPDGNKRTYEIVSVAEVKDGGFAYNYAFSKISEYREYLKKIADASLYDTGYDCDVTKKMVTLSTCRSTGSGEGWRVILVGKETSVEKIQDVASWYKEPDNEYITILDVEQNVKKTTEEISNLKEQRKQQELQAQEVSNGTNQ